MPAVPKVAVLPNGRTTRPAGPVTRPGIPITTVIPSTPTTPKLVPTKEMPPGPTPLPVARPVPAPPPTVVEPGKPAEPTPSALPPVGPVQRPPVPPPALPTPARPAPPPEVRAVEVVSTLPTARVLPKTREDILREGEEGKLTPGEVKYLLAKTRPGAVPELTREEALELRVKGIIDPAETTQALRRAEGLPELQTKTEQVKETLKNVGIGLIPIVGTTREAIQLKQNWGRLTPLQKTQAIGSAGLSAIGDVTLVGKGISIGLRAVRGGRVVQSITVNETKEAMDLMKTAKKTTGKAPGLVLVGSKSREDAAKLAQNVQALAQDKKLLKSTPEITIEAPASSKGVVALGRTDNAIDAVARTLSPGQQKAITRKLNAVLDVRDPVTPPSAEALARTLKLVGARRVTVRTFVPAKLKKADTRELQNLYRDVAADIRVPKEKREAALAALKELAKPDVQALRRKQTIQAGENLVKALEKRNIAVVRETVKPTKFKAKRVRPER